MASVEDWLLAAPLLFPLAAAAQVPEHIEYAKDVDSWKVEVWAGALKPGGLLPGPARETGLREPVQMCFLNGDDALIASDGVLFLMGRDLTLRRIAGTPGLDGYQDGPGDEALLGRQVSVCPEGRGGAWVEDRSHRTIRRLARKGTRWSVETVAWDAAAPPSAPLLARVREEGDLPAVEAPEPGDGLGRAARFHYFHSNVIADESGNAYIMDADCLRRITPEGRVVTLNPRGGTGVPAGAREPLESAHFRLLMGGGMCFGGDGNT